MTRRDKFINYEIRNTRFIFQHRLEKLEKFKSRESRTSTF